MLFAQFCMPHLTIKQENKQQYFALIVIILDTSSAYTITILSSLYQTTIIFFHKQHVFTQD